MRSYHLAMPPTMGGKSFVIRRTFVIVSSQSVVGRAPTEKVPAINHAFMRVTVAKNPIGHDEDTRVTSFAYPVVPTDLTTSAVSHVRLQ